MHIYSHYLKIKIRHACCAFYQSKTNFFCRKGLKTVSDVTSRALFIQLDVSIHATWNNLICCKKGMNVGLVKRATWLFLCWSYGKTGNKNVQLRLALQHHWKTNWRGRCTLTYSRINVNLSWNKLSLCTLLKVVAKNRTIPFSLCNLQQPDLCLICGRLNVQHRFSTRSALE